jgi:hypothetical protein
MLKQSGQVLLILLLVMAVGLGIGISVIQRSITDVSTASRIEESTRAFSAAEAGVEKALRGTCTKEPCVSFDNSATATIQGGGLLPAQPGQALEYPPISKESIAQFWLADPNNPGTTTPSPAGNNYYTQTSLELFWGNSATDKAAIEVTPIFWDGSKYTSISGTNYKKFYDSDSARAGQNGFTSVSCNGGNTTGLADGTTFYCKQTISGLPANLKLLRVRLLYNSTDQPVAIKPTNTTGCDGCSIPPQAKVITSTGLAGKTSRTVQLFTEDKVVPFFLDYAIFSAGEITK